MRPSTVWIAITLLAVGVCGILDATGVVESSQTIGQWWPVAVVGWALAQGLSARRVKLGDAICAGIGVALLADTQGWASDALVWSSLAVFVGLAIIIGASLRRGERRDGDAARSALDGGVSR